MATKKPKKKISMSTSSKTPVRRSAKRLKTKQWNKVRETEYQKKKANVPDYEFVHKKNIVAKTPIPKVKLETGMIVRFNYKGIDVHEPRPLVLVLNPKWKTHLHGLALRVLSEEELIKLTKMVKVTLTQKAEKLLKLRLNTLKIDIGDPYKFYHKKLKPFISKIDDSCYRTYSLKGISAIKKIDYRFEDMDMETSKKIAKGYKPQQVYKLKKPKK